MKKIVITGAVFAGIVFTGGLFAAAGDVAITFSESGSSYRGEGIGIIDAPRDLVWEIINDYDRHAAFMPGALASKIRVRTENGFIVYKKIRVALKEIEYDLVVENDHRNHVSSYRLHKGPFKINDGTWRLEENGKGKTRLTYSCQIEPDFALPGFVQKIMYRETFPGFFRAVNDEAKRRMAERG